MTAEAAVREHEVVSLMISNGDKKGAINHLKGSQYRDMTDKGDIGNAVHDAIDQYLSTGEVPDEEWIANELEQNFCPEKYLKTAIHKVQGVIEFLEEHEIEVIYNETTIYNQTHGFAGTPDIVGRFEIPRVGVVPAILDIKTSKAIYDDTSLQLAAYSRAEWASEDGHTKLDFPDDIKYGAIIRPRGSIGGDGKKYEAGYFDLNDNVFEMFLGCLKVTNGMDSGVIDESRIG